MSRINPLAKEISAKIVYYGPGLSGKTTTLQAIHRAIKPERRGELVSLATEGDRTIFFDFLPVVVDRVQGMPLRLQLYTVPGQVYYAATRKLVLNGADGVVFVADSQGAAMDQNRRALADLEANLRELGISLDRFPLVIQYNKRDLPGALPVAELAAALNPRGVPSFETFAPKGTGVFDALKAIVRAVVLDLRARQRAAEARPTPAEAFTGRHPDEGLAAEAAAAAERRHEPEEVPAFSFAALWGGDPQAILEVEGLLRERAFGPAVRAAAAILSRLLDQLPGATADDGPMTRASLLGLDGREYLRLCRLASTPDEAVGEPDALFGLYVLLAARLKAQAI